MKRGYVLSERVRAVCVDRLLAVERADDLIREKELRVEIRIGIHEPPVEAFSGDPAGTVSVVVDRC